MNQRVYTIEETETVWMSEAAAKEFRLSPAERLAFNRSLVTRWLVMYAPENRNPN